eukprot:352443-Chlamydomonas_euryale.AAC.8
MSGRLCFGVCTSSEGEGHCPVPMGAPSGCGFLRRGSTWVQIQPALPQPGLCRTTCAAVMNTSPVHEACVRPLGTARRRAMVLHAAWEGHAGLHASLTLLQLCA